MLCTIERKILRKIYGPIPDKGRWSPRWNSEICNLYKDLNVVDDIQIRRLGRASHIIRMVSERIPKKVLVGNFIIQDQREDQEQVGTSSGRTHPRSY
jgi:hypothetical protein